MLQSYIVTNVTVNVAINATINATIKRGAQRCLLFHRVLRRLLKIARIGAENRPK